MRILILTSLYPNPYQPQRATFNREQVRLLGEKCRVRVVAPIAWTDEWAARRNGSTRIVVGRRAVFDGLDVEYPRYLFTPKVLRGQYGRFYRASVRDSVARALDEFQPDLIYTPWAYPDGWAAVELGRDAGLPVVLKVHGSDVLLLDQNPGRRKPTVEALRNADAVLAVSGDLASRVIALGIDPSRVHVHYDGIDPSLFCPGPAHQARVRLGLNPATPIILTIGNLVPVKGQDRLIEACARLAYDNDEFMCYLIGEGPLRSTLVGQADRLGLKDRIRFVGAVEHDQLPDWYRAANVFALPSHSEGVPTVLLEAAGCGVPFVASHVGGIPEISHIGPCRLIPPGDVESLSDALQGYLNASQNRTAEKVIPFRTRSDAVDELERFFQQVIRVRAFPKLDPDRPPVVKRAQAIENSSRI